MICDTILFHFWRSLPGFPVNLGVISWWKNMYLSFIHGCCPINKMPKNLSRIGIVFAMVLPQHGNIVSCNHNLNKECTIKGWVKRSNNKGIFVFNLFRILTRSDPPPHYINYIQLNQVPPPLMCDRKHPDNLVLVLPFPSRWYRTNHM